MVDHRWCWGWTLKDAIKTGKMDRNSHGTITASLMVMNVAEGVDSHACCWQLFVVDGFDSYECSFGRKQNL